VAKHEHRHITDVGIDLDGVVYPFTTAFRKYCQDVLGDGDYPDPQTWTFYKEWDISSDNFTKMLEEGPVTHNLFANEVPMEGSQEAWELLRTLGVKVHVITSRPHTAWAQTAQWLVTHGLTPDHLFFTHDKAILSHVAEQESAMIDDHVEYYEQLENAGVISVLRNQPWNRHKENARRAESLLEFATLIEKVNNREISWVKKEVKPSGKFYYMTPLI